MLIVMLALTLDKISSYIITKVHDGSFLIPKQSQITFNIKIAAFSLDVCRNWLKITSLSTLFSRYSLKDLVFSASFFFLSAFDEFLTTGFSTGISWTSESSPLSSVFFFSYSKTSFFSRGVEVLEEASLLLDRGGSDLSATLEKDLLGLRAL